MRTAFITAALLSATVRAEAQKAIVSIETPDAHINQVFEWSKAQLDENDTVINTLALSAVGQFEVARAGLTFFADHQRADGKITHEISRHVRHGSWFRNYPYTWLNGNTTPFWILACYQYWLASNDDVFLRQLWPSIVRAFRWSAATDTNGDGLIENAAAGAGSIPVGATHESQLTDVYLAGVWTAALEGVQQMARSADDGETRTQAAQLAAKALLTLEDGFWLEGPGTYVFALLRPAKPDAGPVRTNEALTAWPTTALSFGLLDMSRADRMLTELASSAITADWGVRLLSRDHPLYDPARFDNGAIWPFVTGFAASAHYEYHRAWAGHDLMRDMARASFDFVRGRMPELMHGTVYQPLERPVPQQFFATSMFVTSLIRGLVGWKVDAPNAAAALEPHMPAEWSSMRVSNLRVGRYRIDAAMTRERGVYTVSLRRQDAGRPIALRIAPALPTGARIERIVVDDRDAPVHAEETAHDVHGVAEIQLARDATVEFHYHGGVEVVTPAEHLEIGDTSHALKVLDFRRDGRDYVALLEGIAGESYTLQLRSTARIRTAEGSENIEQTQDRVSLRVAMPAGDGFVRKTLRIRI